MATEYREEYFEERLITEVQNYEHLWCVSSKKFSDRDRAQNSWQEIALKLGRDVGVVKAKWKYLRDNYMKLKKETKHKSGDAAKKKSHWKFFESLFFLNTLTEKNETETNVSLVEHEESANSQCTSSSIHETQHIDMPNCKSTELGGVIKR